MAYSLSDAMSAVTDHPWIAAGAVVFGVILLSRGGGSGGTGGAVDQSATLASMQIASDTNVALAGIQAQREATSAAANRDITMGALDFAGNTQYIQAQRDAAVVMAKKEITLGTIDYAKTDREAGVTSAISAMDFNRQTAAQSMQVSLAAFQSALGFSAAQKDLDNQLVALNNNFNLGMSDISSQRELGVASIASSRDLGIAQINANTNVAKYSLDTDRYGMTLNADTARYQGDTDRFAISTNASVQRDTILAGFDLEKYLAPMQERMHQREQATVSDLAWRQKQIAKISANTDIFGGLISSGFGFLNNAAGAAAMASGGR